MPRLAAFAAVALLVAACGKKEEPAITPTPVQTDRPMVNQDSIDAANAERARLAAEQAARDAAAAAEAARAELVNELAATVHFDYDQYAIRQVDEALLARKAAIMRANPNLRIRVVGHADERGSDEYNLALGMRRAASAKDYLARLGVEAGRIETASLGEEVPVDPASNESAWAANRRAEFDVVAGGQTLVRPTGS
ncbi:MAG TPA: OmpA family protein [Gemmatimonadales bacterium]|nr:OmpA family protein [Gemmatimonadota bacterium]HPF60429.1 OmpA family protein [Gemmatimonadales bacterium]